MENKFDEIFLKYSNDVFRLSYSYVLNKLDAEDIVQKAFYKLYKNKKMLYKEDLDVKRWIFRVTINESKNILKSSWFKTSKNLEENFVEEKSINSDNSFLKILESVPENYRICLYLFYYEGYSIKEIAIILKKKESAIKMRLSRGKDFLKEREWL